MPKRKLKTKCDKCGNPPDMGGLHLVGGEIFLFCKVCDAILKTRGTNGVIQQFLDGTLDIGKINKDMIQARIDRNSGKGKWKDVKEPPK